MTIPNRFMVVDDDPINNMICKFLIHRCFAEAQIELFTEPEFTLSAINEEYIKNGKVLPTILFLDINMPGMSGWDFLDIFKNLPSGIHEQFTIIVLSSSVDHRDEEMATSNPFVSGFLCKPLTADKIMQMVGKAEKILV